MNDGGVEGGLFFDGNDKGDYHPLYKLNPLKIPAAEANDPSELWRVRVDVSGVWHSQDSDLLVLIYDGESYLGGERGDNGAWFHSAKIDASRMGQ